jgi:hypothetical protein
MWTANLLNDLPDFWAKLIHREKTQKFRRWTEIGSGDFAWTFLQGLDVAVLMECLAVLVNSCSGQLNALAANRAERVTCADEHIAPRGEIKHNFCEMGCQ